MKIKGFVLRDETVSEIGKFAVLWNLFEHDRCGGSCSPGKIAAAADALWVDAEIRARFAEAVNERRRLFNQIESDYVLYSLHPDGARVSPEKDREAMRRFLAGEEGGTLYGCLLIIYRIRNNLMHGMKQPEELDAQIALFRAANDVLERLEERKERLP